MNILIKQDHICQENSGSKIRKETEINQTTRYIKNKIPVTYSPTHPVSNQIGLAKLNSILGTCHFYILIDNK